MFLELIAEHKWIEWVFSGVGVAIAVALAPAIRNALGAVSRKYSFGIAGNWNILIEGTNHPGPHGRMALNQIGQFVWGTAEIGVTQAGRADRVLRYRYWGKYSREQAVLRFQEVSADDRLIGATVLKVDTRGDSARGCNAFWDHINRTPTFYLTPSQSSLTVFPRFESKPES